MSASTRVFSFPVSGLFYCGEELFVTTQIDKLDKRGTIVGDSGALLRVVGNETKPVFQSDKFGLLAGTALSSGDFAVGTSDSEILVLGPNGAVRRRLPSGLMPYHKPDFLVAGGSPETIVVASAAYSNAKSSRAAQWDTSTWTQGKPILFTSLSPLSVSSRGVARTTLKSYDATDSWGVQEYAWKGAPKPIKTPTQRSSWCVSTPSGWFVSDSNTASFIDPSGAVRWTVAQEHFGACAISPTRLAIVAYEALIIVDVADGRVLESQPLKLGKKESFVLPCPIATSASGAVAFSSQSRLRVVARAARVDAAKPATFAARPGPTAAEIAKVDKRAKTVADREAAASLAIVEALEALVVEILATKDVKVLKKAGAKLDKLDVLGAAGDPKNDKRIAKCDKALRARLKTLPLGSPASFELQVILDALHDS